MFQIKGMIPKMIIALVSSVATCVAGSYMMHYIHTKGNEELPFYLFINSFKIIDEYYIYVFLCIHNVCLVILPWLLALKNEINGIILCLPPILISLRFAGEIINFYYMFQFSEFILVSIMIYFIDLNEISNYSNVSGKRKFWPILLLELTRMALTFIYISALIGSCGISLYVFRDLMTEKGKNINFDGMKNTSDLFDLYDSFGNYYIVIYFFFTICILGLDFLMIFVKSIAVIIPFSILTAFLYIKNVRIGVLLIITTVNHVLMLIYSFCCKFGKIDSFTKSTTLMSLLINYFIITLPLYIIQHGLYTIPYNIPILVMGIISYVTFCIIYWYSTSKVINITLVIFTLPSYIFFVGIAFSWINFEYLSLFEFILQPMLIFIFYWAQKYSIDYISLIYTFVLSLSISYCFCFLYNKGDWIYLSYGLIYFIICYNAFIFFDRKTLPLSCNFLFIIFEFVLFLISFLTKHIKNLIKCESRSDVNV